MSENREPEGNGNPWVKSLLVWGGIFLALLLVVSMFGSPREAAGTQIRYSDFREKIVEGTVDEVQIAPDRISGKLKNGESFTTIPVANDTELPQLLEQNGVVVVEWAERDPQLVAAATLVVQLAIPPGGRQLSRTEPSRSRPCRAGRRRRRRSSEGGGDRSWRAPQGMGQACKSAEPRQAGSSDIVGSPDALRGLPCADDPGGSMTRSVSHPLRTSAVAALAALGLSGCASDPAFLETLAYAADTLAYELAQDCQNYTYGYGGYPPAHCSGGYDPYAAIYVAPVYVQPTHEARDRRHHRRDRRHDRGRHRRRGGK